MVNPTSRTKDVSSRDVLRCTARRLQAGRGDKSGNNESNSNNAATTTNWQEKIYSAVNKIWLSVGQVVENALLSTARGVRIESLGTFTLDAKRRARFFLSPDFAARHRLLKYDVCSGGCLAGGAVNCRLNVSRVAATAGVPRPEVERVLEEVLRSLNQRLAAGRPVTLSFHRVAEFRCSPSGEATMKFLPGFHAKEKKVAVRATRARIGVAKANSKPTSWGTASASAIPAAPASGTTGNNATTGTCRSDSAGRRPHSAFSVSRLGNTTDRPKTSHGNGNGKHPPAARDGAAASVSSRSTTTCNNSSPVASSVGRGAVGARTGATSQSPPDNGSNNGCRPKQTALSIASSRSALRAPPAAQGHLRTNPDCINNNSNNSNNSNNNNNIEDDAAIVAPGEMLHDENNVFDHHEPDVQLNSEPRACIAESRHHRPDTEGENQEIWLSGLLRRQALAQAGEEGLRRLTETLKLAHVSSESGGRLSGGGLLLALRSAGTELTSAQLAATRGVFRRQPDRRVSLAALVAAMAARANAPQQRVHRPSDDEESVRGSSFSAPREQQVEAAGLSSSGAAVAWVASSGLPWESRSSRQAGDTTPTPAPSPSPPRGAGWAVGGKCFGGSPVKPACLSESSSVCRVLHRARAAEERASGGSRHGNHEQRHVVTQGGQRKESSSGREENSNPRAEQVACCTATLPQQGRQECWGAEKDSGGGFDGASGLAGAEDAIADLARIVFHSPSSLERFLHVLQANKINERPTMSCTALAARLVQMRPGLGRTRARQLAAAACRYPDKQVDLGQLHAALELRFGRRGGGSLVTNTITPRIATTAEVGEQKEAARVGGRRCPRAVGTAVEAAATAASPQGTRREMTTKDGHSGGPGSGGPGGSQRRIRRLAEVREEREIDAGKNGCRGCSSEQLNHKHPPPGAEAGGRESSDGVDGQQQQQGRVSASDLPAAAAAATAAAAAAAIHRAEADPASPNSSATTKVLRSGKSAGRAGGPACGRQRQTAATRVQSLFRGHKGRNRAAAEGRKRGRRLAAEREAREEQQRPSAAARRRRGGRISRPKGPSTYGF